MWSGHPFSGYRVEKTCKQHKRACGTLRDSPGTLWLNQEIFHLILEKLVDSSEITMNLWLTILFHYIYEVYLPFRSQIMDIKNLIGPGTLKHCKHACGTPHHFSKLWKQTILYVLRQRIEISFLYIFRIVLNIWSEKNHSNPLS